LLQSTNELSKDAIGDFTSDTYKASQYHFASLDVRFQQSFQHNKALAQTCSAPESGHVGTQQQLL
jgi:hypothetical protein